MLWLNEVDMTGLMPGASGLYYTGRLEVTELRIGFIANISIKATWMAEDILTSYNSLIYNCWET